MTACTILLAEDEPLVGYEMRDALLDAGYGVIGPYARLGDALEAAVGARPHAAIIDMMLQDDSALPLADYLTHRDVPYIIVSGLAQPQGGHYRGAAWLTKPFDSRRLLAELGHALQRNRANAQAAMDREALATPRA